MLTVTMREARTHLSRLVEAAAKGESFIIAKSGKPMVKVMELDAPPEGRRKRLGFMQGQGMVPDDFDTMGDPQSGFP